jgi:hypothetical protein
METLLPIIYANAEIVSSIGALASLTLAGVAVAVMIKGSHRAPAP